MQEIGTRSLARSGSVSFNFLWTCLLMTVSAGCRGTSPDIDPRMTSLGSTDLTVPTPHLVTVMSYNILLGGGLTEDARKHPATSDYPGNRLPRIIEIIRAVNPDILCLQELWFWTQDLADDLADVLDMDCYMSVNEEGGHNAAIYSKFKITGAESYPDQFRNSALHVTLLPPWGEPIEVGSFLKTVGNPMPRGTVEHR